MAQPVRPAVVCSVLESEPRVARRRIQQAPAGCELVELRADRLPADEVRGLVRAAGRPLIVTARRAEDGGRFRGSEEQRRRLLLDALDAGAAFIDVEWDGPLADLARGPQAPRVILSHHGAPCRIDELRAIRARMGATRAARLKIVARAESVDRLFAVRDLLQRCASSSPPLCCFAEGAAGTLSRVLAPSWGSWATYGSAAVGAETAPGQLTARELVELHDVLRIGRATRCFALVGRGVRHSPSPAMHTAAFRALDIDARYLPIELESFDEIVPWLGTADGGALDGLAVTMPFKSEAAHRCEPGDEVARVAGVVNTVRIADRSLGYNTDAPAAVSLVGARLDLGGARVAVVGAGGTGRALTVAFRRAGCVVTVYNRTVQRAAEAARRLGVDVRPWAELRQARWDVLLQTTPLGRRGERVPVELSGRLVLDVVYGPEPTPLVREARQLGLAAIEGLDMLVAQAELQFERLTDRPPDPAAMRRAAEAWLRPAGTDGS